jgi:hypothetical protein
MRNEQSHGQDIGAPAINSPAPEYSGGWRHTPYFALLLVLVILVGTYYLVSPLFAPAVRPVEATSFVDNMSQFSFSRAGTNLYFTDTPPGLSTTDIFSHSLILTGTAPSNLTNSVDFAEYFPQPSPVDDQVAFLAISSSGDHSLRMRQPDGQITDLSYQAATDSLGNPCSISVSAPPQWNENGRWIAVLTECGAPGNMTIRLFAFSTDRSSVVDLSPKARHVMDFHWIDPNTLVFSDLQANRQVSLFRVNVNQPEPEQFANLSTP